MNEYNAVPECSFQSTSSVRQSKETSARHDTGWPQGSSNQNLISPENRQMGPLISQPIQAVNPLYNYMTAFDIFITPSLSTDLPNNGSTRAAIEVL